MRSNTSAVFLARVMGDDLLCSLFSTEALHNNQIHLITEDFFANEGSISILLTLFVMCVILQNNRVRILSMFVNIPSNNLNKLKIIHISQLVIFNQETFHVSCKDI